MSPQDRQSGATDEAKTPPSAKQYIGKAFCAGLITAAIMLLMMAFMPAQTRRAFSAYWIPDIFIAIAMMMSKTYGTRDWLRVFSERAPWSTFLSHISICAAIVLAERTANVVAAAMQRESLPAYQVLIARLPEMTPAALRSIIGSPISEEILFRGWMMAWISEKGLSPVQLGRFGASAANLLTSVTFGTIHLVNYLSPLAMIGNATGAFLISLLLGRAKERSGGLLLPMLCHATINFMQIAVLQIVPI